MDVMEVIRQRRSARSFKPDPVPEAYSSGHARSRPAVTLRAATARVIPDRHHVRDPEL